MHFIHLTQKGASIQSGHLSHLCMIIELFEMTTTKNPRAGRGDFWYYNLFYGVVMMKLPVHKLGPFGPLARIRQ
jgi:uncharacterized membrane protein YhaH (DUF805 family)